MKTLKTLFGPDTPEPEAFKVTRWAADPFALGSFAHIPPGGSEEDYEAMATPIADRLFFAGEATTRVMPGTVQGAFLSGQREAKRILALLESKK